MDSLVSVIVPTKNSSEFLEKCLKSIKNQSYQNIELIVVDNNSTDHTKEIARKYTDKVFNKGPERSTQRNFGVRQSTGKYILIIDSDMKLSKDVVKNCVTRMSQEKDVKAIIIPEESFGKGFWAQCKKLEKSFYIGIDWIEAARFFDRRVYFRVRGYNENMISGEDWDLSQRIEELGKIRRINDLIFHDEGRISLFKTIKKKFYYAKNLNIYKSVEINKEKFKKQSSIINRYKLFLSHPFKLFKNPILGLGMLFMKFCEFGAGGMGYLISKIKG